MPYGSSLACKFLRKQTFISVSYFSLDKEYPQGQMDIRAYRNKSLIFFILKELYLFFVFVSLM
jgi:hypothetical protein